MCSRGISVWCSTTFMNFTLYNILASAITSIGFVGGIILLISLAIFKKGAKKANFFLFLLVGIMTLRMLESFVLYAGFHTVFPHLIFVSFPYKALIGPFFFFYVYYLLFPNRPYKWHALLHLSLFIYIYYTAHWSFTMSSKEVKINVFNFFMHPKHVMTRWGFSLTLIILFLQLWVWLLFLFDLVQRLLVQYIDLIDTF